jgi:hydroxyethylthiazole kinase-like uncharacterized protein yjeF
MSGKPVPSRKEAETENDRARRRAEKQKRVGEHRQAILQRFNQTQRVKQQKKEIDLICPIEYQNTLPALPLDPLYPELMLRVAADVLGDKLDAAVIGPGLGQGEAALVLLRQAATLSCPLVLDADALNLLAADAKLAAAVSRRDGATLMTPHPLEAARLLGQDVAAVQNDRIAAALTLARLYHAEVVLKGAGSVIASGREWWINPTGNPGMATGGMGDVLSGLVGSLAAQRVRPLAALQCAVHLHGAAADLLAAEGAGPAGLTAGETIDRARLLYNRWCAP